MALASRGLRDMDQGPEALEEAHLAAVRAQARRVHVRAGITGLMAMLAAWLLSAP